MTKKKSGKNSTSDFSFVPVSGDNLRGDADTRRLVRSHAMTEYRRRTRPPWQITRNTVELDVTPILGNTTATRDTKWIPSPSPRTILGAGRSDPFQVFPLDESPLSRQLWDHLYDGTCVMFRIMLDIGFLDLIRQSIALPQVLSTSSRHLEQLRGNEESQDHYRYTIQATNLLQGRLQDSVACTANEVVIAVLTFCCYANMVRDPALFNTHMNGLARIIECRGGLPTLNSDPVLRTMLFWVDVNGSYLQDGIPTYRPPFHILDIHSRLSRIYPPVFDITVNIEDSPFVVIVSQALVELHTIIHEECAQRDLWHDVIFPGFHIQPILHALLSLPRSGIFDAIDGRMVECVRLAAIVYLSGIRGRFGIDTVPCELYGSRLLALLQSSDTIRDWKGERVWMVWILTVGACVSALGQALRESFVDLLCQFEGHEDVTFDRLSETVVGFLWCEEALGQDLEGLRPTIGAITNND